MSELPRVEWRFSSILPMESTVFLKKNAGVLDVGFRPFYPWRLSLPLFVCGECLFAGAFAKPTEMVGLWWCEMHRSGAESRLVI